MSRSDVLKAIELFPKERHIAQKRDAPRIEFHVELALSRIAHGKRLADLGGGLGLFAAAAAQAGFKVDLVDDFRDAVNAGYASDLEVYRTLGINVVTHDLTKGFHSTEKFDVITCFDSIEHWHNSPKRTLRESVAALNPGGTLILGVPNCANLRKRIAVPLGRAKWTAMKDWYEPEVFRSHVREPDVDDLRYIARDLKLTNVEILGRNWSGDKSDNAFVGMAAMLADRALRQFPSLCSDIYMIGTKA